MIIITVFRKSQQVTLSAKVYFYKIFEVSNDINRNVQRKTVFPQASREFSNGDVLTFDNANSKPLTAIKELEEFSVFSGLQYKQRKDVNLCEIKGDVVLEQMNKS